MELNPKSTGGLIGSTGALAGSTGELGVLSELEAVPMAAVREGEPIFSNAMCASVPLNSNIIRLRLVLGTL